MSDLSPGERAVLRFRWFVYDAGARPVVVTSVLILLAVLAAMAAALVRASTDLTGGFRNWVFFAQFGFTADVQLAVLIAAVLLVIGSRTGGPSWGLKSLFWAVVVIAASGVVANVGTIVVSVTDTGVPAPQFGTTAEWWTEIITGFLAPAVVASTAVWTGLRGKRLIPTSEGVVDEP